jgi:hypothetical protein
MNRYVGNLPPLPGVFPNYPAPVVRIAGDGREMVMMRCGMPPPPRTDGPPVTNIRNTFGLVRTQRGSAAVRVRRHLDRIQGRPGHQIETGPRTSPRVRLPDDGAECHRRADPFKGDAGDLDDGRRARCLDARAMG